MALQLGLKLRNDDSAYRAALGGIAIIMSSVEKKSSFTKTAATPLLDAAGGANSPVSPTTSTTPEMNRISWGRAIGLFNLYVVWLILDLVGL